MTPKTVLVVDDNEAMRIGLAAILQRAGYSVVLAENDAKARQHLLAGPRPDIILVDMIMAGNGWNFLDQIRSEAALVTIPVVIMTGLPVASAEWAASLGAVGYLHKAFDADALLKEVGRHLGGQAAGGSHL